MPGVGLKKKGEDEVSTDVYRIYSNDINRLLTKCVAKMAGYFAKFFFLHFLWTKTRVDNEANKNATNAKPS